MKTEFKEEEAMYNTHQPVMKCLWILFSPLLLTACSTVHPSAVDRRETVVGFLGEPLPPGVPQPEIMTEPTGVRWTIFRNQVAVRKTNTRGEQYDAFADLPDTPLGINLGHGLFLDSQSNLAILPFDLWPQHWQQGVRYDAVLSPDVWKANPTETRGLQKTPDALSVFYPGIFGPRVEKFDTTAPTLRAMEKQITRSEDGTWKQSSGIWMWENTDIYEKIGSGVKHTVQRLTDSTSTFITGTQSIVSSDNTFSVTLEADHWKIVWGTSECWLFVAADKALLLDVKTGQFAFLSQTPTGAVLTTAGNSKNRIEPHR
jgi:hypothetical protein